MSIDRLADGMSSSAQLGLTAAPLPKRTQKKSFFRSWVFIVFALLLSDAVLVEAAARVAHLLRFGSLTLNSSELLLSNVVTVLAILCLQMAKGYNLENARLFVRQLRCVVKALLLTSVALLLTGFLTATLTEYSRIWVLLTLASAFVLITGSRFILDRLIHKLIAGQYLTERVVIVGANERSARIIQLLRGNREVVIAGLFDDRTGRTAEQFEGIPTLGSTDNLISYVREVLVDRVIIAIPWTAEARIQELLQKLRTIPVRIDLCPHNFVLNLANPQMLRLGGIPMIETSTIRVDEAKLYATRALDFVFAALLLLLGIPMLIIALLIRLDSPGPALFRQSRYGFNNEVIVVLKFRSMFFKPVEERDVPQARRGDPRVTRIGRFLRKSSLDELPQLINVLQGSMSLVGPRPHAIPHNQKYAEIIEAYFARHNVKPGMTGWAQIHGLRGETETDDKMRKRVELDLYYIDNWSIWQDMKILLLTPFMIWRKGVAF